MTTATPQRTRQLDAVHLYRCGRCNDFVLDTETRCDVCGADLMTMAEYELEDSDSNRD